MRGRFLIRRILTKLHNNMKKFNLLMCAASAMLFSACQNDDDQIREFVNDFADKVQTEDVRAVHKFIPSLKNCEDFAIEEYNPDAVLIEKKANIYYVQFSEFCSIIVRKEAHKPFRIVASFGIAVFDPDLYNFALRTGWINKDMDDSTVNKLLSETEFRDVMIERISNELRSNVTVTGGLSGGATLQGIAVNVTNDTEYNIPAEAYQVLCDVTYDNETKDKETVTLEGEDLPSQSTKTLSGNTTGTDPVANTNIRLVFDPEWLPNLCMLIYKANGHEYTDWKEGKE